MAGSKATMAPLSPKQSLRWRKTESQTDGHANMLDSRIVLVASSVNGAKILASGLVVNGESPNH